MTDYKNELQSVFDNSSLWDIDDVSMGEVGEFLETQVIPELIAKLEALLSQHSKKRELEAYKKGYIDGGIKEITK